MTSLASGSWPPGEVVVFFRSWKEGSQVASLTKHLSIRRRACTTCCRSKEVVVEEIECVPAAAGRAARPERQRWVWCGTD